MWTIEGGGGGGAFTEYWLESYMVARKWTLYILSWLDKLMFWRDIIIKFRLNYADDVAKYLGDQISGDNINVFCPISSLK